MNDWARRRSLGTWRPLAAFVAGLPPPGRSVGRPRRHTRAAAVPRAALGRLRRSPAVAHSLAFAHRRSLAAALVLSTGVAVIPAHVSGTVRNIQ